ncbi:23S rRNA (adenine(2503)-C(2))-methyltransferase RlmN [Desulfatitalea alkaliphila]|uniref:23S rRNA (Adenine(2503)-C(2))-methyltransferase RlmN n=1 Tax=Desulfatitalea alkaliphila TaxID=2929485 RepID=A0AA41R4E9_9BACT|nr:23S rRNA (adenine(2503)-C(2))-methyltransferase RlmN [Desulfatitalea alkaliphila]
MNPLALTYAETVALFRLRYGRGDHHAAAFYRGFHRLADNQWRDLPPFLAASRLAQAVADDLAPRPLVPVGQEVRDGVAKKVFALPDGLPVETVVIPMARHTTVCVSCQVGCRMGCRFCETGRMGFRRNLTPAEIVAQVHAVRTAPGPTVRNVVFMGMGEPLDNFDNVIQAIRVLSDQRGLNIALRRITVSTVGIVPGIARLAALGWPQLKLAVSLNAADDDLRSTLMPINRRYGLAALREALTTYPLARGNVLLVEYVLIRGVNDQEAHADRIAAFIEGLPVRLNLIPCNPGPHSSYDAPSAADVARFRQYLIDRRLFVRLRRSKGCDIQAACGQLGSALQTQ